MKGFRAAPAEKDLRKKFMRVMQCWHWLPREVVAVSSLETSKVRSDQAGLVEDVPAFCRGVGLDGLQRSLPTQTLYIKIKMEGGKWLAQGNF